jgi:xylulokinase
VFGVPVSIPSPGEYVAVGAARQAAWALGGGGAPPAWAVATDVTVEPDGAGRERAAEVRGRYAATVAATYPQAVLPRPEIDQ